MTKTIITLSIAAVLFYSCDKINDPVTEIIQPGPVDTTADIKFRKILFEESTGQYCGNCPRAARYLYDTLVPRYKDHLITLALHVGSFADPHAGDCYTADYRTPDGDEYNSLFGLTLAQPSAVINRKGYPTSILKFKTQWNSEIYKQDTVPAEAWITMDIDYNETTRIATINSTTEFLKTLAGDYKICLALTEDSIVSCQLDYDQPAGQQDIVDYVHRHMFRGTINTTYGNYVASDPQEGQKFSKTHTYTIPAGFNVNHCAVVAYVYDPSNYRILQAEEQKIKE